MKSDRIMNVMAAKIKDFKFSGMKESLCMQIFLARYKVFFSFPS